MTRWNGRSGNVLSVANVDPVDMMAATGGNWVAGGSEDTPAAIRRTPLAATAPAWSRPRIVACQP